MKQQDMTLEKIVFEVIDSIPQKIYEVLSNVWSLGFASLVFCGTFLGERLPLLIYISIAILIDALWGIRTAVKTKRFIFSKLITKSAIKIAAYVTTYALVALVEKGFIDNDFTLSSSIVAAILITSELWSVLGHISLAKPDWIVIEILKRHLKGEMSRKLNIDESELDEILKEKKQSDEKTNN